MTDVNPLKAMIAKWTDSDDPDEAIHKMDIHAFNLMRRYPDGVPTVVLTTAVEKALDYTGQFLIGMVVDTMGEMKGWDDEEKSMQILLGRRAMRLLSGEAWIDTLNEHLPPDAIPVVGDETEES